ncbi:hypothetical protein Poly51_59930 [Rubripirellula tenax]|uniref:Uncharacterized protein n=1 Tax=Rubripirellula tenax TaxID=2528015 RepID=A0A5C6E862_9BACT|nr:hypothetical protein [Rubripirellula tenax]TWU44724.1 hypothetical protein Poly51_59930 [Rubripirellula tenax]
MTYLNTLSLFLSLVVLGSGLPAEAGEDAEHTRTIDVPATYPGNWLQPQPPVPNLTSAFSISHDKEDGTIAIKNATPSISTAGDLHRPESVTAFADLGDRSILLAFPPDSKLYKTFSRNAVMTHGDARLPRFDVVGNLRYAAPIVNGKPQWLNPVPVLDVKTVRFFLVSPGTP